MRIISKRNPTFNLLSRRVIVGNPSRQARAIAGYERANLVLLRCLKHETLVIAFVQMALQCDGDEAVAGINQDALDLLVTVLVKHEFVVLLD